MVTWGYIACFHLVSLRPAWDWRDIHVFLLAVLYLFCKPLCEKMKINLCSHYKNDRYIFQYPMYIILYIMHSAWISSFNLKALWRTNTFCFYLCFKEQKTGKEKESTFRKFTLIMKKWWSLQTQGLCLKVLSLSYVDFHSNVFN